MFSVKSDKSLSSVGGADLQIADIIHIRKTKKKCSYFKRYYWKALTFVKMFYDHEEKKIVLFLQNFLCVISL